MSFDLPGVKPGSDIEILFKAVGFIVIQWGVAEQSLDLMVASIFHAFDGHPLLKRRPQQLEPKIEFLEKCFAEIPRLAQFRAESASLLPRFAAAGKKRNELVHGAISEISIEDGAFMFLKVDVKPKEHHSIRSVFFAESDWPAFRKELLALGRDGQTFAQRVWDNLKVRT
jgi:hypothetical protein